MAIDQQQESAACQWQPFPQALSASTTPSPARARAALKGAGVQFVSRYLATGSSKVIDSAERDSLFAAGLTLLLNWEQSSGDYLIPSKGSSQGASAAQLASALGYPTELPILVSCDREASSSQYDTAAEYFTNFKSGSGWNLGAYAQSGVANRLLSEGLISFVWAPNATSWNQGVHYDRLDIQQHFGTKDYPSLRQFGNEIDPDTAAATISVWSGSSSGGGGQPSTGSTYTVRSGDSWWSIAESQMGSGSKDTELAEYNGKTVNDVLHPGDVLKIPPG